MTALGSIDVEVRANLSAFNADLAQGRRLSQSFDRQVSGGMDNVTRSVRNVTSAASGLAREARSADIQAYGQELDRLRARYDPVFASSQRYEEELNELNRAHRVGAISSQTHGTALNTLNARYASLVTASNGAVVANNKLQSSARGVDGQLRFLPVQLSQIVQQLIAGQPAYQVAIQQGNDINQALGGQGLRGTLKSLSGAFVSLINPLSLATIGIIAAGGSLVQWAFSADQAEDEALTLSDRINGLSRSTDDYSNAIRAANDNIDDLVKKYGSATVAARQLLDAQEDLSRVTALETLNSVADEIADSFGDLGSVTEETFARFTAAGRTAVRGVVPLRNAIAEVEDQLGLTNEQSTQFISLLDQLRDAEGPTATLDAFGRVRGFIEESVGGVENLSSETRELVSEILEASQSAAELAGNVDGSADSLSVAVSEANALADAIASAANAAIDLEQNSQNSLAAAQARLQFRNDPVGLAGELAGQRFDQRVGDTTGVDPLLQRGLEQRRDSTIAAAEATARLNAQVSLLNRADREAAASARRRTRSTGRSRAISEAERERQATENLIANLEREQSLIGATNLQREISNNLRRAGSNATDQQKQQITSLTQQIDIETSALERQRDLQQSLSGLTSSLTKDFVSGIREGESALESLRDVGLSAVASLTDAFIDAASKNLFANAFGGGSGGSGGGGFFGSLFGGIGNLLTFEGGGFTGSGPRSGGVDGRGGFPAILHPNELVIDQTRSAGRSPANNNSQQEVIVRVVSNDEKFDAFVERGAARVVQGAAPGIVQQSLQQTRRNLPGMISNIQKVGR